MMPRKKKHEEHTQCSTCVHMSTSVTDGVTEVWCSTRNKVIDKPHLFAWCELKQPKPLGTHGITVKGE